MGKPGEMMHLDIWKRIYLNQRIIRDVPNSFSRRNNKRKLQAVSMKRNESKQTLLVHCIPKVCTEKHIKELFERMVNVSPTHVDPIQFKKNQGISLVHFASESHANLAFDLLSGEPRLENSGKLQKKVYLLEKNSDYIKVRKSVTE